MQQDEHATALKHGRDAFMELNKSLVQFSLSLRTDYVFAMFTCLQMYFLIPFGSRSLRELRFGNGKQFKYDHVLRFTASSHLRYLFQHAPVFTKSQNWLCFCHVHMLAIVFSDPFWLKVTKGLLLSSLSSSMPCFTLPCSGPVANKLTICPDSQSSKSRARLTQARVLHNCKQRHGWIEHYNIKKTSSPCHALVCHVQVL